MKNILVPAMIFLMCQFRGIAQHVETIAKIDDVYQSCLDGGVAMLDCTRHYNDQMDSMLNVIYKEIQTKFPDKKQALKSEQHLWLKGRDKYFLEVDKKPREKELSAEDNLMVNMNEKSTYVHDRILKMIKVYLDE